MDKENVELLNRLLKGELNDLYENPPENDADFRARLVNITMIANLIDKADKNRIAEAKIEVSKLSIILREKAAKLSMIGSFAEAGARTLGVAAGSAGLIASYRAEYKNGVITSGSTTLRKSENLIK